MCCAAATFHSAVTVLVCVCLFVPLARTIEVHEDVNEGPIGAHLRVNASIPHTNATASLVNERNVNDLPSAAPPYPLYRHSEQTSTTTTTNTAGELLVASNFTAFPSNHKQHSGASAVHGQTSSPLTTEVVAIAGITSFSSPPSPSPPPATPTPTLPATGLSSFRAANGHLYPGRGTSTIVNDRSVQHQISGYRKRQLYASAAPRRNVTNGSSEGQFAKEFIPSPEVIPFFNEENSTPGNPTTGTVDAPYPTGLSDGDTRWYAGGMGPSGNGYIKAPPGSGSSEEAGKWDKYTWTTPSLRHQQQQNVQIKFPHDATPHFPSPKGKWKWIPEEENESTEGVKTQQRPKVGDTPFSSAGTFEEHHFGRHQYVFPTPAKNHPYSFDRTPTEGAFSLDPVVVSNSSSVSSSISSSNGGSGIRTESTETNNGIGSLADVKLVGKEDAHLKSVSPWKKIIHVLSAAIPIGLLISALTPQVVYINPNATQPPIQLQTPTPVSGAGLSSTGLRQRSLGQDVPRFVLAQRGLGADPVALVKLLRKLNALEQRDSTRTGSPTEDVEGMNRLMDTGKLLGCDWKLLCQLARQGMSGPGTDAVHKMLWKIVSEQAFAHRIHHFHCRLSEWTGRLGLEEIFRIIREGDCDRLQRTCDQDT